jgi:hypothetical protein
MHHQHRHDHHHGCGCHESHEGQGGGPAWFYGYHHASGQMKMMNYPDYVNNAQTTVSKVYNAMGVPSSTPSASSSSTTSTAPAQDYHHEHHGHHHGHHEHHHDCGCGCEDKCREHDCHCECCISCADAVEFARCGELRQIPLTFDNDTRREKEVKLVLGGFMTEGGTAINWPAELSETEFKLGPCGHKTVMLRVGVECGKAGDDRQGAGKVEKCTVGYATLRAEGCTIRPMVIAVAVLPNDCGAHQIGCQCGCCGCC